VIVGLGVDAVDIARVERLLVRHPRRAVERLFTGPEALYARARPQPARHFAVRLAAKEAAYKALSGTDLARGIGWRDIEVVIAADGSPALVLRGIAARRAAELGARRLWVSLTHSESSAVAVVVVEAE
jgi:holo-[acyl-carrier protein] synthase